MVVKWKGGRIPFLALVYSKPGRSVFSLKLWISSTMIHVDFGQFDVSFIAVVCLRTSDQRSGCNLCSMSVCRKKKTNLKHLAPKLAVLGVVGVLLVVFGVQHRTSRNNINKLQQERDAAVQKSQQLERTLRDRWAYFPGDINF